MTNLPIATCIKALLVIKHCVIPIWHFARAKILLLLSWPPDLKHKHKLFPNIAAKEPAVKTTPISGNIIIKLATKKMEQSANSVIFW